MELNKKEMIKLMEQPESIRNDYLFDRIEPEDKDTLDTLDDEHKSSFLKIFCGSKAEFRALTKSE